jgi:hypothetical protein
MPAGVDRSLRSVSQEAQITFEYNPNQQFLDHLRVVTESHQSFPTFEIRSSFFYSITDRIFRDT